MPTTPLRPVLQAALACTRHALERRTDAELLRAFATARDEAAFAELVRRHGRLVRGAARRMVGDVDAAEDVFQAAFLLLARKAASVSWGPTVGPWLYQAAHRLAAKARSRAARRRPAAAIGPDVPAPAADPAAGLAWAEVRAALDHALAALPATLRDPLVLCYLEGLTRDEAAAALGCSAAAVKGRVARGRERLRRLLAGRGLSLADALAAPLVAESAVQSGAAAAVARAAATFRTTGTASPAVRELLRGTLTGWRLAAALSGMVLTCAAAVVLAVGGPAADPAPPPPAPSHPGVAPSTEIAADAFGDPLPDGAVARLGTRRFCGPLAFAPTWISFSKDGKKIVSTGGNTVPGSLIVWDTNTGRPLVERAKYTAVAAGWREDGTGIAPVLLLDGSYFVSAFTDPSENLPAPRPAFPPPRNVRDPGPGGGQYLALSPDATRVAVARNADAEHFTIDVLPATPGRPASELKPERTLGPFPGPCQDLQYTAGGRLFYLSGSLEKEGDWSLSLIDPEKNAVARSIRIPPPGFTNWRYMLALSGDAHLAAFAPCSKLGMRGSGDGTIRVWDFDAGKELWSLRWDGNAYGAGFAFTADSKRLVISTTDHYIQVWDLATGKEAALAQAPGRAQNGWSAAAAAMSADGKRLATVRSDGLVNIWDAETGKDAAPLAAHRYRISSVAVSPNGRLAATFAGDESIRVWDLAAGTTVCSIPARDKPYVYGRPLFTPDGGGLLFTVHDQTPGGQLAMADPMTGRPLDVPEGMRGGKGRLVGFTADGKTMATLAKDTVTLWDWPAGTVRLTIVVPLPAPTWAPDPKDPKNERDYAGVDSVSLSADGRFVFTYSLRAPNGGASTEGAYASDVWDAHTGKHLHRLKAPKTRYQAAFSPDGRVMYLGGNSLGRGDRPERQADGLTAWDPTAGTLRRRFADPVQNRPMTSANSEWDVNSIAASADGRLLAAAQGDMWSDDSGSVWIYETATGEVLKKLTGHSGYVADLAFTPDGRRLVSVSDDMTGLVWDVSLPALGGAPAEKPSDTQLAESWGRLAAPEPRPAYAAIAVLAAAPQQVVPLLRTKLRPAAVPTDADLDRVLDRLNADDFADREKASAELERFGPNAVAGARARLSRDLAPEARKRLTQFLDEYDGPKPSPYYLRSVRGVAVLEAVGTADARALLAELAKGPADDVLTREAGSAGRRAEGR